MQTLNNVNVSLNFNLRQPNKKTASSPIYCVVKIDRRQLKVPTGLKVYGYQWDKQRQQCADKEDFQCLSHRLCSFLFDFISFRKGVHIRQVLAEKALRQSVNLAEIILGRMARVNAEIVFVALVAAYIFVAPHRDE